MEAPPNELAWAVHHLATAAAEVDAATARRMGLSAGDFLALKHLMVAGEPIGPVELGRLLGLTSGAATGLVDRLERAGWVARAPHPGDRRRQILTATPRAAGALLAELRPLADDIAGLAAALPVEERHLVTGILHDLARLHRRHTH
ncbi:MarR family winged helix-turn-helix transcriptional regulator [Actinoplanes sp. CA-131856]